MSAPAPEKILVIDDEIALVRLLEKSLKAGGFEVMAAFDGLAGFEAAAASHPDLILLDLMMPRHDGYDFLRWRAEEPALRDTPVVVLTAYGGDREVVKAIDAGADDFVLKPVSLEELNARLRARLRDRRTFADLRGRRRDQELLLDLSTALASQLEAREILFTVATRLAELLQVDRVSFTILSRDLRHGYVLAASEDREAHNIRIPLESYPEILEVARSRQPLLIPDVASHPVLEGVKDALARTELRSLMLFPLVVGDEVLGVIFLRARSRRVELSPREDHICRIVANATAIALRNAQIVESVRGETQKNRLARQQAESRVRALQRYEELCESTAHGLMTIGADEKVRFVNRAVEAVFGRARAELVGLSWRDLVAREDEERAAQALSGALAGAAFADVDVRVVALLGTRTLSISGAPLAEEGGVVLSLRDVTPERTMHRELAETKDFLEELVRQSADAIVAAEPGGRILLWNEAAERLLGWTAEEARTRSFRDVLPPGELEAILDLTRAGHGRLAPVRREVLSKAGERIAVRMSGALLHVGDRERALVCMLSDVRAQDELQARLVSAQDKLAERPLVETVAAEVAGTAAHELNQPLTSLLGLAEILRRDLRPEDPLQATVVALVGEAERLAEIVRKLGRLTRYETKPYVGGAKIVDLERSSDG